MRVSATALLTVLATVHSAPIRAQDAQRLVLSEVVAEAVVRNPEIAAAERRHDAALERPAQERALPDPVISGGWNASGNPLPGAGLGTEPVANVGFMVSQALPYPGKRDLKAAIAGRDADAEQQQIDAARLDIVARVKQAYYRLAYTYEAADVLTRNRDVLATLLEVSESRYTVGQAAQQDVIKAQTQISILDLQLERVRQERATREGELNALLARPAMTPLGRPQELALTPFDATRDGLIAAAAEHAPGLRRDQILVERSQLGVEAARKEYKPDFALSGGYYYMGAMPAMYEFRIDVNLPLQRAKRAAAVAEQLHSADAARQTYESSRLAVQGHIDEDFQTASTSLRLARLYRDAVLPQARLALESSMSSYQTGGVDFLSVMTNFGTVLEYEMSYFDELASYHTAVSRLEQTTGTSLVH